MERAEKNVSWFKTGIQCVDTDSALVYLSWYTGESTEASI